MAATATLLLCLYASFSTIVGSNVYRKDVKIVAQFAAEQLDLRSNSFYHSRLDKIVAASSKYGVRLLIVGQNRRLPEWPIAKTADDSLGPLK